MADKAPTKPEIQQTLNPAKVAVAEAKPSSGVEPLGLEIRGEGSAQTSKLFDQLKRMTRVQNGKVPDLIWDLSDAKITTPSGKVVAVLADHDVPTVQRIVDQWTLLNALDKLTIGPVLLPRPDPMHPPVTLLQLSLAPRDNSVPLAQRGAVPTPIGVRWSHSGEF